MIPFLSSPPWMKLQGKLRQESKNLIVCHPGEHIQDPGFSNFTLDPGLRQDDKTGFQIKFGMTAFIKI